MDRGAWRPTVHVVAKSLTLLSDFHYYRKRNTLSKEINLMYSACWEEERPSQALWRDETTTLLLRDAGSDPAHSSTDDWKAPGQSGSFFPVFQNGVWEI